MAVAVLPIPSDPDTERETIARLPPCDGLLQFLGTVMLKEDTTRKCRTKKKGKNSKGENE